MDEYTDSLREAKIFSTLDSNSRHWHVTFEDEDRNKTGFTSHQDLYHFAQMPFGLKDALETFQQTMNVILACDKW